MSATQLVRENSSIAAAIAHAMTAERREREPPPAQQVTRAVQSAQRGDREAHRFLYVSFSATVQRYVFGIVRDQHDAEDITQQVFLKLMSVIERYRVHGDVPFAAWLLRVARNVAVDHLRARQHVLCEEVHGPHTASDERGDDCRRALQEALAGLHEDWRAVILMRHLVGLSPGEIAVRLSKSEPAIHGLHNRGANALRHELARLEAAPTTARSALRAKD